MASRRALVPAQDTDDIFETNPYAKAYRYYMIYFIGIFSYSWLFLQAATVLAERNADVVSLPSIVILMTVSVSWILYAFLRKDRVIMVGSTVSLIGSLFLLGCVFFVTNFR